jgi:hypothetical protein
VGANSGWLQSAMNALPALPALVQGIHSGVQVALHGGDQLDVQYQVQHAKLTAAGAADGGGAGGAAAAAGAADGGGAGGGAAAAARWCC